MNPFAFTLPNGGTLTGLENFPPSTPATPKYVPLLICLHGGTYSSSYFDALGHGVRSVSDALGVPLVAINRAGYKGTSPFGTDGLVPEISSYQEEEGRWLHDLVLPILFEKYAGSCGATCIVLLTHSIATPPAIIASGMQALETKKGKPRRYVLGGLVMSGWGFTPPSHPPGEERHSNLPKSRPARFNFPPEAKDAMMLGPVELKLCDPAMYKSNSSLGTDMSFDEVDHGQRLWFGLSKRFTERVEVPILHALGQMDALWPPTAQEVHACEKAFPKSPKVESGVVPNAPHCIELSYQGMGWYTRAFGFAMECAAAVTL